LLDLGLPGVSGVDAMRRFAASGTPVLVISAAADRDTVLDAIAVGARGYLTKGSGDPAARAPSR
jgi:two-component system NarL family response regulator